MKNRILLPLFFAGIVFGQSVDVQHRTATRSDVREATRELKQSIKGVERKLSGIQEGQAQASARHSAETAAAAEKISLEIARKASLDRAFQEELSQKQVDSVRRIMLSFAGLVLVVIACLLGLFFRRYHIKPVKPAAPDFTEAVHTAEAPISSSRVSRISDPDVATLEKIWKESHVKEVPMSLFLTREGVRVSCMAELRFDEAKYPLVRFENGKKVQWKDRMKVAAETLLQSV